MNMQPAIDRRVRHYEIHAGRDKDGNRITPEKHAMDAEWGYLLGRMLKDGAINKAQHEAGNRYAEDVANWLGLAGMAFPSARAQNLFAVRGHVTDETETKASRARKAKAHVEQLYKVITTDEMESFHKSMTHRSMQVKRGIITTINSVCIEDNDYLRNLNPLMKSWLICGLNRLARFYQLEQDE